jgi:3',5'-cyclic AMP phosphodiesterase CpdA
VKFIQLTDTHVIGGDRLLFGANPARRLRLAVDSINREHADAAFVIVTGDMTHWGDAEAYEAFNEQIGRLQMPVHLMVGNHDDTSAFANDFHMPLVIRTALCNSASRPQDITSFCSTPRWPALTQGHIVSSAARG